MRRLAPLLLLLGLAACGQKGSLYLPDEGIETVPVSTGPAATAAPAPPAETPAGVASPAAPDPDRDKPTRRN
jgi:predicted small lipoprotein YifL